MNNKEKAKLTLFEGLPLYPETNSPRAEFKVGDLVIVVKITPVRGLKYLNHPKSLIGKIFMVIRVGDADYIKPESISYTVRSSDSQAYLFFKEELRLATEEEIIKEEVK